MNPTIMEHPAAPPVPAYVKCPAGVVPSNQPDMAVAEDWLCELDHWIRAHGLAGYDPFDIKEHPLIRVAQPYALTRRAATACCDLFPNLLRRVLRIAKSENPKAHALLAQARLRLFELSGREEYLSEAEQHLHWLLAHAAAGYGGLCWGYPFRVYARGVDTPAGTPVLVVSAIAGQAFLQAHAIRGSDQWLDAAQSVSQFIVRDIPRMASADGTHCFGYTPQDRRRVHNANLLAVELLARTAALTGASALWDLAEPALRFTLSRQREDGSWTYGEIADGEPFEAFNLRMIDHHHTGFVLRSLFALDGVRPVPEVGPALWRGFDFYRNHLFGPWGMPVSMHSRYPVDIHACAEAVLCPSVLAARKGQALELATMAIRWAHWYLRDSRSGATYYRRYRRYTSKLVCPRWGIAWMYRAAAEYVYAMHKAGGNLAPVTGKSW